MVPADPPLRPIRAMADEALRKMDDPFDEIHRVVERPSIAPEWLLRAWQAAEISTAGRKLRPKSALAALRNVDFFSGLLEGKPDAGRTRLKTPRGAENRKTNQFPAQRGRFFRDLLIIRV